MAIRPSGTNLPQRNAKSLGLMPKSDENIVVRSFSGDDEILFGDFGEPASQLSTKVFSTEFVAFLAIAADDFILDPVNSGTIDYHITQVSACFTLFMPQGFGTVPPSTTISDLWEGAYVMVMTDNNGIPAREFIEEENVTLFSGLTDANTNFSWGQHDPQPGSSDPAPDPTTICDAPSEPPLAGDGPIVALQYVTFPNIIVSSPVGTPINGHAPYWPVSIPVSFYLNINTQYWLSIIPRYGGLPQTAWCFSSVNRLRNSKRGATFVDPLSPPGDPYWADSLNFGDVPPAGGFRDLAYSVIGKERRCN